jgi:hypothetical protein
VARTGREGWPAGEGGAGEAGDGGGGGGHGYAAVLRLQMIVRLSAVEQRRASSYFMVGATGRIDGDAWWRGNERGRLPWGRS